MQRTKNIRLIIILAVSIAIVIVTHLFTRPSDAIDIEKDIFAVENTVEVNKVTISGQQQIDLAFERNQWYVNNDYEADPQRINVLFAILNQVKVRRKASSSQLEELTAKFKDYGNTVSVYIGNDLIKSFEVLGIEEEGLTYFKNNEEDIYLVEIPGYRSYLGGIFNLDKNGWRDPLVFDLNWANLADVTVTYPSSEENDMYISFEDRKLKVANMKSDSIKVENLINDISLLYVNDYLTVEEAGDLESMRSMINVKDIAGNNFTLSIFNETVTGKFLVQIDSADYALIDAQLIKKVTKPRSFFIAR